MSDPYGRGFAAGRAFHERAAMVALRARYRDPGGSWAQVLVQSFYLFPDPAHPPGGYLPGVKGVGKGEMADGAIIDFDFGDILPKEGEYAWLLVGNGHAWMEDRIRPPVP